MSTKLGAHVHLINIYLHEFFQLILIDSIFRLPWYSPWSERELWPNLKANFVSETGEATPTKIGLHAFHTNLYLHEFFERILFFGSMDKERFL